MPRTIVVCSRNPDIQDGGIFGLPRNIHRPPTEAPPRPGRSWEVLQRGPGDACSGTRCSRDGRGHRQILISRSRYVASSTMPNRVPTPPPLNVRKSSVRSLHTVSMRCRPSDISLVFATNNRVERCHQPARLLWRPPTPRKGRSLGLGAGIVLLLAHGGVGGAVLGLDAHRPRSRLHRQREPHCRRLAEKEGRRKSRSARNRHRRRRSICNIKRNVTLVIK